MFDFKRAIAQVSPRLRPALSSTAGFLRRRDRLGAVLRLIDEWTYVNHQHVPEKYILELFPSLEGVGITVAPDIEHPFELPYGERFVLAAVIDHLKPEVLFEFGTFTGATTTLLADCAGNRAVVHTIDLPASHLAYRRQHDVTGRRFQNRKATSHSANIVSHRCDTKKFDYSKFVGRVDLVYVDASHEYMDVIHDSHRALEIGSDRGIIVWDDYQASCPGVVRALTELSKRIRIARIHGTRLALHCREWSRCGARGTIDIPEGIEVRGTMSVGTVSEQHTARGS